MRFIPFCCVVLLWGWIGSTAQAFCFCPCPMPCCIVYEMRPVIAYRPEWREEKVPCVIRQVNLRREVTQVRAQFWVPKQFDEKVRTAYYTPIPRAVEREVPRCVMVPMVMVDPCTGCCFVSHYPQWVAERVRCVEYDYRKEERDVPVKVWRVVQEERVIDQVRWIPEVTEQQSWTVRRSCVWVPYQTTVCVPVLMPYAR